MTSRFPVFLLYGLVTLLAMTAPTLAWAGAWYLASDFCESKHQSPCTRTARYYVPTVVTRDTPILVCLHGGGGDEYSCENSLQWGDVIMAHDNFVAIFPRADVPIPGGGYRWTQVKTFEALDCQESQADCFRNAHFIATLPEQVLARLSGRSFSQWRGGRHRTGRGGARWLVGFSSGGGLTWNVLCYRSSWFDAFGIVGHPRNEATASCGQGLTLGSGNVRTDVYTPKPVSFMYGTLDTANGVYDCTTPPGGYSCGASEIDALTSLDDLLRFNNATNGSAPRTVPDQGTDTTTTTITLYDVAFDETMPFAVLQWAFMDGASHAWPKIRPDPSNAGSIPEDFNAHDEFYDFFLTWAP